MSEKFVFLIRPLSVEKGFALECEGILSVPLQVGRLFEAVLAAGQIGQGLDAEVQIFDARGEVVEIMELHTPGKTPLVAA